MSDKYGPAHRRRRKQWAEQIAWNGGFVCWRCGRWVPAGEPWDLGHIDGGGDDDYAGPECRPCNRGTAAARGNRMRGARKRLGW